MNKQKRCFVIMPFGKNGDPEYEHNLKIYKSMIKPVVEKCGYQVVCAEELEHLGNITRNVIEFLHKADLVIADLSGKNANVFYELGVRHTIFKSGTIPIIKEGDKLPFDISNYRAIFYSSEADGPKIFQQELEWLIRAFDKIQSDRSDNPVHDILGSKLSSVDSAKYLTRHEHEHIVQQCNELIKQKDTELINLKKSMAMKISVVESQRDKTIQEVKRLEEYIARLERIKNNPDNADTEKNKSAKTTTKKKPEIKKYKLRNIPAELSASDVKSIVKKNDFFCKESKLTKSYCNPAGKGVKHQYKLQNSGKVILDLTSGLMWQKSGLDEYLMYEHIDTYIEELNHDKCAGFDDWRLPTLEEAMSLMEPKKNGSELYIAPVFDKTQQYIWTSDPVKGEAGSVWIVDFNKGCCDFNGVNYYYYVRAVRSGH